MTTPSPRSARDMSSFDANIAIEALLAHLNVPDWDVLITADGSGQTWETACGWAGVVVDRQTRGRKLLYGGVSAGSNYLAEALPFLHAMSWYDQSCGSGRLAKYGVQRVVMLTDSEALFRGMSSEHPSALKIIWGAWTEMRRLGYVIEPRWLRRSTIRLNVLVDAIAGRSRVLLRDMPDLAPTERAAYIRQQLAELDVVDPATAGPVEIEQINPF